MNASLESFGFDLPNELNRYLQFFFELIADDDANRCRSRRRFLLVRFILNAKPNKLLIS